MSENHSPRLNQQLVGSIVNHMVDQVVACGLQNNPFPHFVASRFVPDDVYAGLLASLPTTDCYEPFGYERHHTQSGDSNRFRFSLESGSIDSLADESRELWYAFRHALGSRELKSAVFTKLGSGLRLRYGKGIKDPAALPGFALPELFRETEGYTIPPHPDTRKKVVTMQFSLASDESQVDLGTEFYKRSTNPAAWLRSPYGFEIVKRMPFLPNTVYAFSVLNTMRLKSWHGRTSIDAEQGIRNSLLNIWYENVENANMELAQECGLLSRTSIAA